MMLGCSSLENGDAITRALRGISQEVALLPFAVSRSEDLIALERISHQSGRQLM
jgi:hypothetical protein